MIVTKRYLLKNPQYVFVFGDNLLRQGKGGAAVLRDLPNTYGFITKKAPNNLKESFFQIKEYEPVFLQELEKLEQEIQNNPDRIYLISKLGSGLANRHKIWEEIIQPCLKEKLGKYANIMFLWED